MIKRLVIVIIALLIIFGGIFGYDAFRAAMTKKYMQSFTQPPASVTAEKAAYSDWHPQIFGIGSVHSIKGVALSPKQAGVITHIYFDSGETVKAGTVLVKQDTAEDEQDLANYKAALVIAKQTYDRAKALANTGYETLENRDKAKADYDEALANLRKTEVIIDQKHIRAPFAGKLGLRKVNVGQYLQPGSEVVSIEQINPLRIIFNLPQDDLPQLHEGQQVKIVLPTDLKHPLYGKLVAIDSAVDTDTRNVGLQANVSNPDFKLLPGMYVNVYVMMPEQLKVLTIPQSALSYNPYGDFVYVVKHTTQTVKGKKVTGDFVSQVFVTPGEMRGGQVQITKGLKAGDLVVTSGQIKIQDHAQVKIVKDKNFKASATHDPKELH